MNRRTLASVDGMVAVRMAQLFIADAQRAVRDKAIFKPQPPTRPRKKLHLRDVKNMQGQTPNTESIDGTQTERTNVSRRYREARPWLSAREVRVRAFEDLREREAMPVGSATKHTYSVAPKQGVRGEQARRAPAQRILDGRNVATMPREIRHIKRKPLPRLLKSSKEKPVDMFGQGDKVKLATEKADQLAFGG